ncbi:HlyD family efflux transporter periplasmic adaptor subunit [uncultured Desulfosarcina sp.]|uniref:HlyD family secretion protein n=1 Tax=uncultured Desulfosarcina sp. TaxID=218289 RepID=UPI0029C79FB8|nr:HlyD family efflux transporter periplasmic adaptor subunit [uncultured Desulfosarcina sp.]
MKVNFENRKAQDPTRVKGMHVPYAPAKRRVTQWRWYLILLLVASPLLFLLWRIAMPLLMVVAPGYISLENVSINSTASGVVEMVHVQVGDWVAQNQRVITLYNAGLVEQRQVLRAEQDILKNGSDAGQSVLDATLKATIRLSRDQAAYRKKLLDDVQWLYDRGAATIAELNQARAQYEKARSDLLLAEGDLAAARESRLKDQLGPDRERSDRLRTLDAKMQVLNHQMRRLQQTVHKSGRVLDMFVAAGEAVSPGTPLLALGQTDKPYAVAYLDPKHSRYGRKGQRARVKLPNGQKIHAVVRENAGLTRRIPADISSPINARDVMILVPLDLLEPLPLVENVDGLPVTIRFIR